MKMKKNSYSWGPNNEQLFKEKAFNNGKILVQVYQNNKLIDSFERKVATFWTQSIKNNLKAIFVNMKEIVKNHKLKENLLCN